MATTYHNFSGMVKWAKTKKPSEKYNKYEIDMYLDEESWDEFRASGIGVKVREDEDGRYVRFSRPAEKVINGEKVEFGPPEVEDEQGNHIADWIGNGSKGTVNVVAYTYDNSYGKGTGHRWQKLTVNELVSFTPESKGDAEPSDNKGMDDEIPF